MGRLNNEPNNHFRSHSEERGFAFVHLSTRLSVYSATPADFALCRGAAQNHVVVAEGDFSRFLRDGRGGAERFDAILHRRLSGADEQIFHGLCFEREADCPDEPRDRASEVAVAFINQIPRIKYLLSTDVKAILDGDPAAKSPSEIIFCYPAVRAILHQRVAHELLKLQVPVIPRIITEMAHSETGIDIHPGAQIGEYFSIDHGTGVVIGQTAIVGNHVRLYQGVTLGAKSFTLDEEGLPMDVPRHPIIEDDVTIYSNTSVLGRITIGRGSVIGGNIWLTHSVPPYSKVLQTRAVENK